MATITTLGTGSGLDLQGILTKLMTIEQRPLTLLASKEASFQAQLSAYGTFNGALSALQSSAQTLTNKTTFTSVAATVADTSLLSASVGSGAAAGSYKISIGQLAQAEVLRSNTNFAATTDTFNTGTITLQVGGGAVSNISIDSSNNTLAGIRDAINAGTSSVTATIVNDGATNRLLLSSKTTGLTAGTVSVSVTDSGSGGTNALSTLNGASLVQVQAPLDARFSVNGLDITRSTNTISDVISGVTLNLAKAGTLAVPLTTQLNLTRNTSAIQSAVASFVSSYNTVVSQIKSLTAYDAANKTAALLTGDSTLRNIQSQLSNLVGSNVLGLSGNISRISDIGISVQKDGTLSIDTGKLTTALNDSSKDISGLFSSTGSANNQGMAVRFNATLTSILGSTGLLANRTDGINQSIKDIGKQRDALSLRLTRIEASYRAQFAALDKTISSMQSTASYLTQQLDYLKAIATGVSSSSSSSN